jgi:hypothetical protein
VNATPEAAQLDVSNLPPLRAIASEQSQFDPLAAVPFRGNWTFTQFAIPAVEVAPFSQVMLTSPEACLPCTPLPGDFDKNGQVGPEDYDLWREQFGASTPSVADGNLDGRVTAADFVIWRNHLGQILQPPPASAHHVPEPAVLRIAWPVILLETVRRARKVSAGIE